MSNEDRPEIIDVETVEILEDDASNAAGMNRAETPQTHLPVRLEFTVRQEEPKGYAANHDAALANNPERRCAAHKRNGEQCRKFAIHGSTVCRTHGGATRHIRNKARIRIENASDRLVSKLIEFAFDDTKPPDTQLRAIRDALDRSGLKPPAEVVLSQAESKPFEQVFDSIGGTGPDESIDLSSGDGESFDQGDFSYPDQPSNPPTADNSETATPCARKTPGWPAGEYGRDSSHGGPLGMADPGKFDRDGQPGRRESARSPRTPGPPEVHITGMAAIRMANEANREAGVFEEQRAIESPHRRYLRP
ncbi:hypothetical protein [Mycobacterium sp. 1423905.2]|uniref:hypothetical protein n=1 Tax=Mycobacterium sp. 1423905.2 TaxID=1856859 RepID=UPI000802557F|nr:hypothetical protein [Mycobacterium sp. 1423905.2]OBJ61279.1 hypothetical protein A9W95_09645 [Mycobacterium sp. 1423905.2]